MNTDEDAMLFEPKMRSADDLLIEFRTCLEEMRWTAVDLADHMLALGDYRPYKTILRNIHRALEGEVKVSGEMLALVNQTIRFKRRLKHNYDRAEWIRLRDGSLTTKIEDFTITLLPQSKERWKVNLIHETGYSPPWPRWQADIEGAKIAAFITLDSAQNWLLEVDGMRRRDEAV